MGFSSNQSNYKENGMRKAEVTQEGREQERETDVTRSSGRG